jgi:hypothetical protein
MGIIDDDGVQWERTNCCGEFVKFDDLIHLRPSTKYIHGLSVCDKCVDSYLNDADNNDL